ncbi:MAG: hypothetical protein MRJ96_11105 [Nitrospirales bacterium]|nr:hypothetical protein [Nitrospira sp.]MDR4501988.1 hypothetical protein [Nitrospirales bacterium]
MSPLIPKAVREFLKDVKRASHKEKKSMVMSIKKAQDIAETLEGKFDARQISHN